MRHSEYDCARYGNDARWALAREIRTARNVARAMNRRANEITGPGLDWRLANAYRAEARSYYATLIALRNVSRTLRGV
jgi:hypothetical protein